MRATTVGKISAETLVFTAGKDPELDSRLLEAECIASAAHATMLAGLPVKPGIITPSEKKRLVIELVNMMRRARQHSFKIALHDQDVHLAVERILTERLGTIGKKIHTGRSRNDQVATDLRLYARDQMMAGAESAFELCETLLRLAQRHKMTPMAGRTHMQPAMPSSVGLWASAFAEGLLDDIELLKSAYALNDRCPLGSAAGYGVPLPVNRQLVSDLLGFSRPIQNVIHAGNTRGKMESIILCAAAQLMITLSRLAQDLIIFTMPEFNYFTLPVEMCTGSSIMPQKKNPDVLELIRAKTARVFANAFSTLEITRALPSGYNRDAQETKEPLIAGLDALLASLRIMNPLLRDMKVNRDELLAGFSPAVFAADKALELAAKGMPFRDAYASVKANLNALADVDPVKAIGQKRHLGATAGLNLKAMLIRLEKERKFFRNGKKRYHLSISRLLGVKYPLG